MLSRVADSLFWVGRYAERTETNTHVVLTALDHILEQSTKDVSYKSYWTHVVGICGFGNRDNLDVESMTEDQLLAYVICDKANYNSIELLIDSVRFNLKNVRDIIPIELYEVWNELYLEMPHDMYSAANSVPETTDFLQKVRRTALTATGVIDSLMIRDESFQFLKIGKWMERSEKTALIVKEFLNHDHVEADREFSASIALSLTNALDEYTRKYRSRDTVDMLNFILKDANCSRSVAYGIRKIRKTVEDIEGGQRASYTEELFRLIRKIEGLLTVDAHVLSYDERIEWVDEIGTLCTLLGPVFSKTYYLTPPIAVDQKAIQIIGSK